MQPKSACERLVGDSDTGRGLEAIGLLTSGSRVTQAFDGQSDKAHQVSGLLTLVRSVRRLSKRCGYLRTCAGIS